MLNILFFRYDNRRRMGVEVIVLTMLATPTMTRWEIPEKYHSTYFVIDMLVSCRHRFQKPSAAFFWSKQSEVENYAIIFFKSGTHRKTGPFTNQRVYNLSKATFNNLHYKDPKLCIVKYLNAQIYQQSIYLILLYRFFSLWKSH